MINSEFHKQNRQKLIKSLKGGVVVLSAFSSMQRDNDSAYPFVQESNFWWLTGVDQPDWWLVIDGCRGKNWLVSPEISDISQVFNGSLDATEAMKISGVDSVISRDECLDVLSDLAKKHSVVYSVCDQKQADNFDFVLNPAPRKMYALLDRIFRDVQDCRLDIAKLRAIKDQFEITAIKKAIKSTIEAFDHIKRNLNGYDYEYQIEAEFTYSFIKNGLDGHAFDPIVASGQNACTLHYGDNRSRLKKRSLVLMDIGAKFNGYPADITRTYAYYEPTVRQTAVHKSVDQARKQIIDLIRPGMLISEYRERSDAIMLEALKQLDLYQSNSDFRRYFPHAISHGLGVDTHDSLGRPMSFLPGMVLTVEPGIYIKNEKIGVRIEDDILVTDSGRQNLTAALSTDL